jgi:hypothetical protein
MAILVSPGVSVTVTDESQYGPAGPGTVPLIVIATKKDKIQPGSAVAVAPGTTKANAGKLYLITSQRDALQTFGNPTFYSSGGTVQQDNQLNELGLFTLYEYLGIANQAYAIRADVDLGELIPTSTEPSGPPTSGQSWLDLSMTTWGIFRSNGNPNPAFSWQARPPLVINSKINLERVVQGCVIPNLLAIPPQTKITSGSSSCISVSGNLIINNVSIALTAGMSISTIASKINSNASLNLAGITASVTVRNEKYYSDQSEYGDVYNLRIAISDVDQAITLIGSTAGILTNLGLSSEPTNYILPKPAYGAAGDFAVNTLAGVDGTYKNEIWEKISVSNKTGSTVTSQWFKVGSTDGDCAGWGWREAAPRVVTGSIGNPTLNSGDICRITIGSAITAQITVPSAETLESFVGEINTAFNDIDVNATALAYAVGSKSYLRIINWSGTDIVLNDVSDQDGVGTPLADCGMPVSNTYWSSVIGTEYEPTFVASQVKTASAAVVAAGTGYLRGDALTVVADNPGDSVIDTVLAVASIKAVSAAVSAGGSGYSVNDVLTVSGTGTTPVKLKVTGVSTGAVTSVTIMQAGQYTGATPPSNPVSVSGGGGSSATFNLVWGVNTVTVNTPGQYLVYPDNPVAITGGTGTGATFDLTPTWYQSESFTIDPGTGPITIHVPAETSSPDGEITLDELITAINTVGFPSGPIVASNDGGYLKLTNTNKTSFTVEDLRGNPSDHDIGPLMHAGIPTGVTFGRALVFKGYSPNLTVPSDIRSIASTNVWINTTPANQGANLVTKQYSTGSWKTLNIKPNTGTVPMYASDADADIGFGSLKQIGTVYAQYNTDGTDPPEATVRLKKWDDTLSWVDLSYTPSASSPMGSPVDGTLWYNTDLRADIMVNDGTQWLGYKIQYPATDPNGPILSSSEPTSQSTGASLVDYDIWIDTNSAEYPVINRYDAMSASWILVDNTDQTTSKGVLFADARPNATCTQNGSTLPSDMVMSNDIDPDAPDALLYPAGMMLFNTRYSTNNVKVFRKNYLSSGTWRDRWVTYSGNMQDGAPYMGSAAQRAVVVKALQAVLVSNEEARAEETYFNLISTPGYIECIDEMITLNTDKKEIAFIVADTPATLQPTGTSFVNWANNQENVASNGADGLTSSTPYAAVYYPWGLGTNLDGAEVMVPPSMIALRTIAYNDQVAYPWFAPAGFNRGLVTGVASVGYLNGEGEYTPVKLNQGQRDVMYTNKINPIAYIPGRGLVVYGQKTLNPTATALDRINVARLINYLKYNLDILAKPFLFEPNDSQTRQNVTTTFNAFMQNLITLRALYDFAVVCDESNNTPARIDRNELWIDIAIKPEKAIEFIYIPIRILNTGDPMPNGTVA